MRSTHMCPDPYHLFNQRCECGTAIVFMNGIYCRILYNFIPLGAEDICRTLRQEFQLDMFQSPKGFSSDISN